MAHDRLNHGGILLFVHEERRQRMPPEVVEAEPLHNFTIAVVGDAVLDPDDARSYRSRANIVFDQLRCAAGLLAVQLFGWKNEVFFFCIGRGVQR